MKNSIKLFGVLLVVFGVFVVLGTVSASDAEILQPAEEVVYNEDVTVNGTMRADSAYIGSTEPGVGGVTFFNGTMINASIDEEGEGIPLTLGDDVRIDGEIWRMEKGGDNPIRISDNVVPTITNTNNFGSEANRWASVWAQEGNFSGNLTVADLSYIANQTRHWSVGGAGLMPKNNTLAYDKSYDYLTESIGSFFAPVHLPDGATVQELEINYWDNQLSSNINAHLERYQKNGNSAGVNMVSVNSSGNAGTWQSTSDNSINNATIDNDRYVYRVRVVMNNTNLRLSGVKVTYTVDNPLP